jgi:hypothetical protein
MSTAEFKAFLLKLSEMSNDSDRTELVKLAELFDGSQNQKVDSFIRQIRTVRGL